ncbi:hypothetical protein Glove_84g177 [Diversispora epigaea]|uniref:Uncharacterized protein n=1 Tax=Diversispora epigaea TaxID=1348612 RepID=A0A397J783_9GLOM|nr:hypothetical protein Glove_84g177 [Diversispora epigaea]
MTHSTNKLLGLQTNDFFQLNSRLASEITELRKENAEISELRKKFSEVEAENIKLKAENVKLIQALEEHESRLRLRTGFI